jgi:methionine-rich copper-binding protein CopC
VTVPGPAGVARGAGYDRRVTHRLPIVAACAAILVAPSAAAAHTGIDTTTPADGANLQTAPAAVVARYAEPLAEVVQADVTVDGAAVAGVRARLAAGDASQVRIPLPATARSGRFEVRWTVRGADTHLLEGTVSFTVARPPRRADLQRIAAALDDAAAALRATATATGT